MLELRGLSQQLLQFVRISRVPTAVSSVLPPCVIVSLRFVLMERYSIPPNMILKQATVAAQVQRLLKQSGLQKVALHRLREGWKGTREPAAR